MAQVEVADDERLRPGGEPRRDQFDPPVLPVIREGPCILPAAQRLLTGEPPLLDQVVLGEDLRPVQDGDPEPGDGKVGGTDPVFTAPSAAEEDGEEVPP